MSTTYPVVSFRNQIVDLVEGRINEVQGVLPPDRRYVFLGGYMTKDQFNLPSISDTAAARLADIVPLHDSYGLALVRGDNVAEYTYFSRHWPRKLRDGAMPAVIGPCPLVIQGPRYRITKQYDVDSNILLRVEND